MRRRFGKNDCIFIGILLLFCVLLFFLFQFFSQSQGSEVLITRDGNLYGTFSLLKNQTIEITDENGHVTNVLKIQDGKADMTEADCPDRLCVHQKAISAENENIVCLPNKVVVTVTGSDAGMDGFAQ